MELLATFSTNVNLLSHSSTLLLFIYLKNNKYLATPSSTPVEDRDVRLLSFFVEILIFDNFCVKHRKLGM